MTDVFLNPIGTAADRQPGGIRKPLNSYREGQQVGNRAAVTHYNNSRENRLALERLDSLLSSGAPPRDNVPRGFYVTIDA